jgi:hypothetical protein
MLLRQGRWHRGMPDVLRHPIISLGRPPSFKVIDADSGLFEQGLPLVLVATRIDRLAARLSEHPVTRMPFGASVVALMALPLAMLGDQGVIATVIGGVGARATIVVGVIPLVRRRRTIGSADTQPEFPAEANNALLPSDRKSYLSRGESVLAGAVRFPHHCAQ